MDASLTFGVELELICIYTPGAFNDTRYPGLILDTYLGPVVPTDAIRYFLRQQHLDGSGPASTEQYSQWDVSNDDGKLTTTTANLLPDSHVAKSIELASPIFRFNDPHCFNQIENVLELLAWMEKRFSCHFIINETCGLHVHFACGTTKIAFAIAKRVYQIFLAHERSIDSIHASSRVTAPEWTRSDRVEPRPVYAPLSAFQRHAGLLDGHFDDERFAANNDNLFRWLSRVEESEDYGFLCKTFELQVKGGHLDGHNAAVNLDNAHVHVDRAHYARKSTMTTIEFRQHLATVDVVEIHRYVKFLGSMITYCAQASDEAFIETLLSATWPSCNFERLCATIDLPKHLVALFRRGQHQTAPESSPPAPTCPRSIENLLLKNDRDNAMNKDAVNVNARRDEKFRNGHYGIKPTAQPLVLSQDTIRDMLTSARRGVVPRSIYDDDEPTPDRVRGVLFDRLARIYEAADDSRRREENEKVIASMVAEWSEATAGTS